MEEQIREILVEFHRENLRTAQLGFAGRAARYAHRLAALMGDGCADLFCPECDMEVSEGGECPSCGGHWIESRKNKE